MASAKVAPLAGCRYLAVVTGSNQGIGFEIARALARASIGKDADCIGVILAVRNLELGREAAEVLRKDHGLDNLEVRRLDITKEDSIRDFRSGLEQDYGRLDVLVNNAGFAFKAADPTPFRQQARPTLDTNYYGTVRTTEALLPLLRRTVAPAAIIVNLASKSGALSKFSGRVRERLSADDLDQAELEQLLEEFVGLVEGAERPLEGTGWPATCYGVSKAAEIAWTRVFNRGEQQRVANNKDGAGGRPVAAFSVCPGWCSTSMASYKGPRSAAKGAETPAWLVTRSLEALAAAAVAAERAEDGSAPAPIDPFGLLKPGGFWADQEELAWAGV